MVKINKDDQAFDLNKNIFTSEDPRTIAIALKKSAEQSILRKTDSYASAMSMLNAYIKKSGKNVDTGHKIILKQAKDELRRIFHKD